MKQSRRAGAEVWAKVKEAVEGGMTLREAGMVYGMSEASVYQRAKRSGWKTREMRGRSGSEGMKAGRKEMIEATLEAEELNPVLSEHRVNMIGLSMSARRSLAKAVKKGMGYLSGLPEEELVKQHRVLASFSAAADLLFGWKALAVVEGEAAERAVRAERGEVDRRAINLDLIRCKPEQLSALRTLANGESTGREK